MKILGAVAAVGLLFTAAALRAQEPLHKRMDALIAAAGKGKPVSARSDDAAFLRRVYLDFAGRIPASAEARAFLADKAADKRTKLIDTLLTGSEYPRRMVDLFHIHFMERLGDSPDWSRYLLTAFEKNKPWDVLARDMLSGGRDEAGKGAGFFLTKRLENYGQNAVDYPALTRDIGRLFLGVNLQCAQCHDHLFIDEYKQVDFQGMFVFVQNLSLTPGTPAGISEKPTTKKLGFSSVFDKVQKETGPRLPYMKEVAIPVLKPGDEWLEKPDPRTRKAGTPKFSTLASLADQVTHADNPAFARNIVNRLWFLLVGRGLVHPLDLHHKDNPPSHPELLALLAKEMAARKYDIKAMLREIALSETYQRSSVLPSGQAKFEPTTFLTGHEKRLSAEQLLVSVLEATGEKERTAKAKGGVEALRAKFLKAFANPAREPEEEFLPALRSALFLLNDPAILEMLTPKDGNLVERAMKLADDKAVEELYLSVLTRLPTAEERSESVKYLTKNASRRAVAVGQLAWALLASTEFCVNH